MRAPGSGLLAVCLMGGGAAGAAACGASRIPVSLRGYEILVERRDAQGTELARALREYGFRVRGVIRGGNRPTAALIFFTLREAGSGTAPWLHLRFADTRTGAIVGAAMIPLDSVGPTPRARADAALRALVATPLPTPP
ncbi:MAG: hypothetical protein ACRDHY_14210 [Anaerolineales bacterium]